MNTIKFLSATLIIAAASSSAFAGTDDGNVASFQARQTAAISAPAPLATAAVSKDADKQAANQADFSRQLSEGSSY